MEIAVNLKTREMQKMFAAINAAAASDATILIMGESGTGKELVAGAIHQRSTRTTYLLTAVSRRIFCYCESGNKSTLQANSRKADLPLKG